MILTADELRLLTRSGVQAPRRVNSSGWAYRTGCEAMARQSSTG